YAAKVKQTTTNGIDSTFFSSIPVSWGAFYAHVNPSWKVRVIDRKNFRNDRTYVVVSNHQSQLDILVAFNLYKHFKWVSKAEIFMISFVGWNMYFNRYIKLVRGDKGALKKCLRLVKRG
ncbi:MAG: 1-acyl-sn-glycerol-3-phosphate acyltransferase, partial [Desulfobacterales bacterium]|nr:1-acyl-sn-glycerol-3-phosphate acyltransferase [Desulfobacterales bacterium]